MKFYLNICLALLGMFFCLTGFVQAAELSPDDTAKFLAGYKTGKLAEEDSSQNKAYREQLDDSWKRLERSRLSLIRTWASSELGALRNKEQPVFYPFSGPDFVHVYAFFPRGTVYLMGGLEPIGNLPDLTQCNSESFAGMYKEIQTSMSTLLLASFFKTNDMKKDFAQPQLNGIVPVLAIFIERSGGQIHEISYVHLGHDGKMVPAVNERVNGVKIVFQHSGQAEQTVYYFQVDVSNDGTKGPSFPQAILNQAPGVTYLKSASYLMHRDGFSVLRDALLQSSVGVLEDDSGIPLHFFDAKVWRVTPYGNYVAPIDLFKDRFQPDLRALYDASPKPKPLPFGIGYKFRQEESMLTWAVKK